MLPVVHYWYIDDRKTNCTNGQDTHFHWATKGSHYVKSGV